MRFAVESWSPEYGASAETDALDLSSAAIDPGVEIGAAEWAPRDPAPGTAEPSVLVFVDGVRRIDARVWIESDDGTTRMGLCASYAAGAVRCDGRAVVEDVAVERGLFTSAQTAERDVVTRWGTWVRHDNAGRSAEELGSEVLTRMRALERTVAARIESPDLLVLDGPLAGRQDIAAAVGLVKTHHLGYLDEELVRVVGALRPGQRTPLFLVSQSWSRYAWYLRLPVEAEHPWAGVVRCEVSADGGKEPAVRAADRASLALPRFASSPHKDPRAPQNLVPIAGLERHLRRRLGDPALLERALRIAARAGVSSPGGAAAGAPVS